MKRILNQSIQIPLWMIFFILSYFIAINAILIFKPGSSTDAMHGVSLQHSATQTAPIYTAETETAIQNSNLKQTIITQNETNTIDSLHRLDSLGNIWAINYYIKHHRFPTYQDIPIKYRSH